MFALPKTKAFITLALSLTMYTTTSFASSHKYHLTFNEDEIHLDGIMDEPAWLNATKLELKYENSPTEGSPAPVNTEVYFYENQTHLNIAFKALDPAPQNIRASLRDRDALGNDDWVGIVVDTFNDKRSGYMFLANPLGAQADYRVKDVDTWGEDDSWDAIWQSAGNITSSGYVVEMSVPYSSLRFPSANGKLNWNIAGIRNYPRDSKFELATYQKNRNIDCTLCQYDQLSGFESIKVDDALQITPTLTFSRGDIRPEPGTDWQEGELKSDAGLDVRWGITKDIVFNATLNPDFSQVEADASQLDINNTFSLFIKEKRPFFLDGASYFFAERFKFVHTKNIDSPDYGLKLTGKTGKHSFGVMLTNDHTTNFVIPDTQSSNIVSLNSKSDNLIARYKQDIGNRSTIGVLMTHRQATNYSNTMLSLDGSHWLTKVDSISYQAGHSDTDNPEVLYNPNILNGEADYNLAKAQQGHAFKMQYNRKLRDYSLRMGYADVGNEFRADMGFHRQVGYRKVFAGGKMRWFGHKHDLFKVWGVDTGVSKSFDRNGELLTQDIELKGWIHGNKQFKVESTLLGKERVYKNTNFEEIQLSTEAKFISGSGLELNLNAKYGSQVDFTNIQLGKITQAEPAVYWDINEHLNLKLSHNFSQLNIDAGELYSANLTDMRFTYKFSIRSLAKLVVQYTDINRNPENYVVTGSTIDSNYKSFSSQLVYTYKVNPQTLFYIGYSNNAFQEKDMSGLEQNKRNLFAKFSYALQM
ncbi:carbohydrate binding family 9 domain-containing protein [Algibacillus agarilyticus]|uniref:carbohydrate binding family 9 domain-containing protein n=1 Tax=Algibacillus agarilyticus TaxID=2234133 RepID=UPI000DD02E6A|nr:carbohydrate binding family 9 domain-containing protein [Algibacillus agarilyticus]